MSFNVISLIIVLSNSDRFISSITFFRNSFLNTIDFSSFHCLIRLMKSSIYNFLSIEKYFFSKDLGYGKKQFDSLYPNYAEIISK